MFVGNEKVFVSTFRNEKEGEMDPPLAGGITEVAGVENDLYTVELARFALDEHNKKTVIFFTLLTVAFAL